MLNLRTAILGDPSKIEGGVRTDFGYLGDMGCLPTPTTTGLTSLLSQGSFPGWIFNSAAQIGSGWRGPYITGAATGTATSEFTKDQWGNDYVYTITGACPLTATFQSEGRDGAAGGGDDIDYSLSATDTTSTVSGFIKDANGNPVASATVTINYPGGAAGPGNLTTSTTTTDGTGRYQFPVSIPLGKRSVSVTPKLIVTSARATTAAVNDDTICRGGVARAGARPCQYLEFTIVNFSSSPVTVSTLRADYTSTPVSFYYRITWGSATNRVLDCDATCTPGAQAVPGTGATRTFTAGQTIAAATPLRPVVFVVDSSQKQLSDIKIGAAGEVGSAAIVQLVNFRDCNTRSDCTGVVGPVSVSGIPFTITFSDGSVVQFTPTATP